MLDQWILVVRRILWGFRRIGVRRTVRGSVFLIAVVLRRPRQVRCSTPDGLGIGFDYPAQMMPTLVLFGDLLEPEIRMLAHVLGPGTVAVDVGASIGTWTMCAARTGARVIACEPDPANLRVLEDNLHRNGLADQVTIRRIGLGSRSAEGVLVRHRRRYRNRVAEAGTSVESGPDAMTERFPVQTVDSFVEQEELSSIDVLKINTAGGEREVVEGCRDLLRRGRIGTLLILDGSEVRSVLDEIVGYGYDMGVWDEDLGDLVTAERESELDRIPRGPMHRYIVLRRRPAADPGDSGHTESVLKLP